jgi:hypothetical protein
MPLNDQRSRSTCIERLTIVIFGGIDAVTARLFFLAALYIAL